MKENTVVSFEYELTENGQTEVLDTNKGKQPLEFMVGRAHIIPGLEKELILLKAGDEKQVIVSPKDAYGEYNQEAINEYPRDEFQGIDLQENMTLFGQSENGQNVQVRVKSFDDKKVLIDYNHPLAGKTLAFSVKLLSLRDPSEEELKAGLPLSMMTHSCGCGDHSHDGCCGTHESHDEEGCCGGDHHHHGGGGCGCH